MAPPARDPRTSQALRPLRWPVVEEAGTSAHTLDRCLHGSYLLHHIPRAPTYRSDMSEGVSIILVLEMAILGLLKRQPMHGYDLRRRLRAEFGLLSSLSFGSLYPALARLEHDGAVRELRSGPSASAGEVLAFTGSFAGERAAFRARLAAHSSASVIRSGRDAQSSRTRKVYELTPAGEQMFERLLTDDPSDGRGGKDGKVFAIRWAFARHLSPEARIRLLERRRSQLEERLAAGQRASSSAPPIDRFERSLAEHARATISFEIAWIDGLISAERAEVSDEARGSRPDPVVEVS